MPKISIITSTYNRAKDYLPKCIKSVKAQRGVSYEHIIVDDCSTDNTEEYIDRLRAKERIVYIKTDKNFGSDPGPKNIGLKAAKGKYVLFLDDDVQLRPGALMALQTKLEEEKLDVVYGDMWIMPHNEKGIAKDFNLQLLSLINYIDTSSALIRKSCATYIGGWDESLPKFVDWNFFVRMAKAGFKFKRLPQITFDYYMHESMKSQKVKTKMYNHPDLGNIYIPTFDPVNCKIRLPYLGEVPKARVAIFTIHYDRLEYSKATAKEMYDTAGYEFDWFCADNGNDGTDKWLMEEMKPVILSNFKKNVGLTRSSNKMIDTIKNTRQYDIIIKIDNDVEFITKGWLKDIVKLWERNHLLYISPYVEGLLHNPGGAFRIGRALIDNNLIEITKHIGGIFAAVDHKAYDEFRWKDIVYHGYQDLEASTAFVKAGYMPCYFPKHIIRHRDTTEIQQIKYKDYFERRKSEKVTEAPRVEPSSAPKYGF